jgi:serine/threonine-protein kinase
VTDFLERLQSVLGQRYRIERELGGGGMSRVFLAYETRLERQVVIKVLPAATVAGLEAGRFEREILVAASLHHPHVVQLLATGEGDGILWYAMPFVEGESLSERLQRGPLATLESVRILREVADALAYAHKRGIVHRDIKPANIMLSGRHALVTDFGVAKALAEGRRDGAAAEAAALTSVGMALGTPAYMAPEQAVADPNVDHRADIYSLGVVAYEMLSGSSPYNAATPQAMLAAHVTQPAQPLATRRGDIPQDLADIVMRCLAKSPDDRYASASDLVDALELVGTPSGGTAPFDARERARGIFRRWHPGRVVVMQLVATLCITAVAFGVTRALGLPDWIWWAVAAVMIAGVPALVIASRNERRRAHATMTGIHAAVREGEFTGQKAIRGGMLAVGAVVFGAALFVAAGMVGIGPGATLLSRGRLGNHAGLLLGDIQVSAADSTLGGAVLEALRVDLSQSNVIHLLQASEVRDALQRMGRPANTPLTDSIAREVAQRSNARAVVTGEVHSLGAGYVLTASVIDAASGNALAQVRETSASDRELIPAVNRLSKTLRERIGESLKSIRASEPLEQVTTTSLQALRIYSTAERAFEANDLGAARNDLLRAVALDSTFAMAWRKLASTYSNLGSNAGANNAAATAYRWRAHLPPLERLLTEGSYANQRLDFAGAVAVFRQALDIAPENTIALNNVTLALNALGRYPEAAVMGRRCITVAPTQFTCYVNFGGALVGTGNYAAADSVAPTWTRNGGDSSRALGLQLMYMSVIRNDAAIDTLTARLDPLPMADQRRSVMYGMLGQSLQRRGELNRADKVFQKDVTSLLRDSIVSAPLIDALGPAFYAVLQRARPADAWPIVEAALTKYPLEQIPPGDRPYFSLGELGALTARAQDVRRFRTAWESVTPAAMRDTNDVHTWDGMEAVASGQWDVAATALRRAYLGEHCSPCGAYLLGYALERGNHPDSSAAVFAAIVDSPNSDNFDVYTDAAWYGPALAKLGAYYQDKGDKRKAIDYLTRFTTLWKNADADLQPRVKEAKARIADLVAEKKP